MARRRSRTSEARLDQLRTPAASCATPPANSFARVGRLLEGAQAMLILTDHEGVIVETIGDQQTLEDGRRIHLEVGGVWNERVVGTNGIGTALWTGEPVFVHAAEHFCAGIKPWSCAGVPIRDPFDNRVVGVVDLSGLIDIFRPHNTALVALAAQEIEGAMARRQNEERAAPARDLPGLAPQHRARGRRDPARSARPRRSMRGGRPSGRRSAASSATSIWACGCSTFPSA